MKGRLLLALLRRPRGVALLALGLALAGLFSLRDISVGAIPEVDLPVVLVSASLPGASPETMANLVAAPLEESLGTISGVEELAAMNVEGLTRIVLLFALDRDIEGAARDVQAAISTARDRLPRDMPTPPVYFKVNPSDAPALFIALSSEQHRPEELHDIAQRVIVPGFTRQPGVGGAWVQGAAPSAVRVRADLEALRAMDLGLAELRVALAQASRNSPKGDLQGEATSWAILANDQLDDAADFRELPVAVRNGRVVRLGQVASVEDAASDERAVGWYNGRPTVFVFVRRSPGANILETAENVRSTIPGLRAVLPASVDLEIVADRTDSVIPVIEHAALTVGLTILGIALVVLFALRDRSLALVAVLNVPLSLLGTIVVMKWMGFSLNLVSLGGLTVSMGLVVDDAIVVVENIKRMRVQGRSALIATLRGTQEVTFTILAITLALAATLAPLLVLGGPIGVVVTEFAVTVMVAVVLSGILALTLTPTLVARLSPREAAEAPPPRPPHPAYTKSLRWTVDNPGKAFAISSAIVLALLPVWAMVPKAFLPLQDTGNILGIVSARPDISFTSMSERIQEASEVILKDPDVESVSTYLGSNEAAVRSVGRIYINLKPVSERSGSIPDAIDRLREPLSRLSGIETSLAPMEDLRETAREGVGVYQFTLRSEDAGQLSAALPRVVEALQGLPSIRDVGTDQAESGRLVQLDVDRDTLARLGVTQAQLNEALYSAFGQRQVVLIDRPFYQSPVVLESEAGSAAEVEAVETLAVSTAGGSEVPIQAMARTRVGSTPVVVTHDRLMPSATVSFNVAPGFSLGDALADIDDATAALDLPGAIKPQFTGNAASFQGGVFGQPLTFLLAAFVVYLVLGSLYESFLLPLAILGTLPIAALGSLLGLLLFGLELSVVAFMGLLLVAGIMMKNAIILVNFAVMEQRRHGVSAAEAMYSAGTNRFRPILMTSVAALLGALPIAILPGMGIEFRQPLGIAVAGGLIVSQAVTLYTTPAFYILLDRLRRRSGQRLAGEQWSSAAPA